MISVQPIDGAHDFLDVGRQRLCILFHEAGYEVLYALRSALARDKPVTRTVVDRLSLHELLASRKKSADDRAEA